MQVVVGARARSFRRNCAAALALAAIVGLGGCRKEALANDPPLLVPGMLSVTLDPKGRLLEFHAVPPATDPEPTAPPSPDWASVFAEAGLDIQQWTVITPQRNPPAYADTRAAWRGAYPDQPEVPIAVEAAAGYVKRCTPSVKRGKSQWSSPRSVTRRAPTPPCAHGNGPTA